MSIRAYLHYNDSTPIMERNYTGPGRYYMEQGYCDFESIVEGDYYLIHMGHGQFSQFECVAADSHSALLIAVKL